MARDKLELLIQWQGMPATEASWEVTEEFQKIYPQFQLEDELLLKEGRDVMWGSTYQRRHQASRPPAE
jgi:hypothetical protein